ncbi:MAG: hypothetical protein IJ210_15240 [Clostridia bacterium]|nr:hypothetical protein [Clostridia bacterium]
MAKRTKLEDIPEIVTGSAGAMEPMDEIMDAVQEEPEADEAPRTRSATVKRVFVANDYERAEHPVRELYADIQTEYGTDFDPWKVNVLVKMGRRPSGESDKFAIRVNGRKYELAYREQRKVPLPIAIAWLEHQVRTEIAEDMADTMTEHYQELATKQIL